MKHVQELGTYKEELAGVQHNLQLDKLLGCLELLLEVLEDSELPHVTVQSTEELRESPSPVHGGRLCKAGLAEQVEVNCAQHGSSPLSTPAVVVSQAAR